MKIDYNDDECWQTLATEEEEGEKKEEGESEEEEKEKEEGKGIREGGRKENTKSQYLLLDFTDRKKMSFSN